MYPSENKYSGETFWMVEMVFYFASLCFHSLCHASLSFWPLKMWRLFLHTSCTVWLLTCWSTECGKWLCANSEPSPREVLYVSACPLVSLLLPREHTLGSLLEDERHLELSQVAPVALADSQPTPTHVGEPSQIQRCCQLNPQMIPATRARHVLLHATKILWFFFYMK